MSKKSQKKVEPVALDRALSAEEREESIRLTLLSVEKEG